MARFEIHDQMGMMDLIQEIGFPPLRQCLQILPYVVYWKMANNHPCTSVLMIPLPKFPNKGFKRLIPYLRQNKECPFPIVPTRIEE